MSHNLENIVNALQIARTECRAIKPFSLTTTLSLDEAYEIQERGIARALATGRSVTGYKLGLTSKAKQQDVQVFEPIRGCLLDNMEVVLGNAVLTGARIQPRFEPEIGVKLKSPFGGETVSELLPHLEWVGPAVEILDSRYEKYQFKLTDVVADNTSASGYLLGRSNWVNRLDELRLFGVVTRKNGKIESTGAPAATFGDPLIAVVELQKTLRKCGKQIEPGQVVLTGGITASVPFAKGDHLTVQFPGETMEFFAV